MRNLGIDLLRGIAAFGIVGCHLRLLQLTKGAHFMLHFCDLNVAVFAVLAGLLMRGHYVGGRECERVREKPPLEYVWQRVKRIVPVYFAWSIVFVVASLLFQFYGRGVENWFSTPRYWMRVVLFGDASCHLWFLIGLLYAQIVVRLFLFRVPMWGMLAIGTACVVWASIGSTWFHTYLLRLLGFVCIGRGMVWIRVKCAWAIGVAALFGLGAHLFLSLLIPEFVCDLIAVVPLVCLFQRLGEQFRNPPVSILRLCTIFGTTSMAVFLVHPIITRVGSVIVGRVCMVPFTASIVLFDWIVCWALAMCFALVAVRLPFVKRFVL